MLEVYKVILVYLLKQYEYIKVFMCFENMCEMVIEEVVLKCKNDEFFIIDVINEIIEQINQFVKKGIVLIRCFVLKEMVREYVSCM